MRTAKPRVPRSTASNRHYTWPSARLTQYKYLFPVGNRLLLLASKMHTNNVLPVLHQLERERILGLPSFQLPHRAQ